MKEEIKTAEGAKLFIIIFTLFFFLLMLIVGNLSAQKVPNYFRLSSEIQGTFLIGNDLELKNEFFLFSKTLTPSLYNVGVQCNKGNVDVVINNETFSLKENEKIVINSKENITIKIITDKKANVCYAIHWLSR